VLSRNNPAATKTPAPYTSNGLARTNVCRRHRPTPHSHQPVQRLEERKPDYTSCISGEDVWCLDVVGIRTVVGKGSTLHRPEAVVWALTLNGGVGARHVPP
jgi:hypothetical protein